MLKVDFEKANDNVNWGFLKYVLRRCGFDDKWLKCIDSCICHCILSVLVNKSPTKYFASEKGLRQGDSLSPFLFSLVVEGLAKMMSKAVEGGAFKGF